MAGKHPKHRKIPKTLLKAKAFKRLENKVIFWVHVLELIVIIAVAAVTVTTAFFFGFNKNFQHFNTNALDHMSDKAIEQLDLSTDELKAVSTEDTKAIDAPAEQAMEAGDTTVKTAHGKTQADKDE